MPAILSTVMLGVAGMNVSVVSVAVTGPLAGGVAETVAELAT